jgi:hypothetical protein
MINNTIACITAKRPRNCQVLQVIAYLLRLFILFSSTTISSAVTLLTALRLLLMDVTSNRANYA